ncbi:MAG: hypothetical protein R3F20_05165 [Planctomycetota bacterium]
MKTIIAVLALAGLLAPGARAQEKEDSLPKLEADFQKAGQADDNIDLDEMKEFAGRALAMARAKSGRTGYRATLWTLYVCRVCDFSIEPQEKKAYRDGAVALIVERYADSSSLGDLLNELQPTRGDEVALLDAYVDRIAAAAKKDASKDTIEAFRLNAMLGNLDAFAQGETRLKTIARLKAQIEKHGAEACPMDWLTPKRTWKDFLAGPIFELEHLYVGATAPDIEGVDVDGVAFKLSDYRGKVVFLDFWGHW